MDATTLLLLVDPSAKPPRDPNTKKPLEKCRERVQFLVESLSVAGTRVIVTTPVHSELLVRAGEARGEFLNEIMSVSSFVIAPFDMKAAVELSFLLEAQRAAGKQKLNDRETWAKLKFDRQIISIAKVTGAKIIYSDDMGLASVAKVNGLKTVYTWELQLPPVKAQGEFDLS